MYFCAYSLFALKPSGAGDLVHIAFRALFAAWLAAAVGFISMSAVPFLLEFIRSSMPQPKPETPKWEPPPPPPPAPPAPEPPDQKQIRDDLIAGIKSLGLPQDEEKAAIHNVNMKYLHLQEEKLC
jgi:hypothetical protein